MAVKSTSSLSILEELLTCSVCLEFFTHPKMLSCHHSFCQTCLEKLENAHSFLCPTCRCRTQVPDGEVAGLPTAFYLVKCKEIHSQMKKETKCHNCDKSNATGYCKMCHESLCISCIEVHNRWSRFSDHKIVDIILVQNLLSTVEQFREVKGALTDSTKKEREARQGGEGHGDCEQWENIDKLLHLLTGEGKSIESVHNDDEVELLLIELNRLLLRQDSNAVLTNYYGAAISRTALQECVVKVSKVTCTDAMLLSFSLLIQLPASVIIPVSSIKCRLIPMIKEKEQHKDKYKITTTSAPGIYKVDCCPLASGAHSLSVHIYDVQLESVSLMVPFNPHFDTIAPARAIYGFGSVSSVAVSNDGLIIFTEHQHIDQNHLHFIKCFNSQDNIVPEAASVIKSYDVDQFVCASLKNDVIVITEQSAEILTLKGELVRKMTDSITFTRCLSCAVVSSITGYIYIADNNDVYILSSDLRFIRSFGGYGSKNGKFYEAKGVAIAVIDGEEFLYVTDRCNHRIQKFTYLGEYLSTFGTQGSDPGQLKNPYGIAIGTGNLLYITECGNHRISIFTFGGDFVRCFGGQGNNIDQFSNPRGITFDNNGVMYVYDCNRLLLY
ncbi:PREDICTED: E3 ubiquitin-protein ligase TRIM71-like [Amphimedon queenslandica]|uniref:RING-type domain-containing protein n=1 Tax=Amphimedon queenslandica TaxID=400682 RepID=A0A1X7V7Z6_AMPQE|nr:PREDICTED: E3 ubiquitin-protein ligase TRIM71-like [Amphimedon queenslandica]|eukprot:XP_019850249.1 PREDICTED: E3 ubiquitin-protein ligase TRIM71-like [Amphimedon queenslandica]